MSWLDKYLRYTEHQVSPRIFHLWSGIAVIAGALERRTWMTTRAGHIYPGQIMVVLVSKSAITKKTTAARMAVEFLRNLEPWQIYMLPRKLSPQQLLFSLQKLDEEKVPMRDPEGRRVHSSGFVFAEELGAFFSTEAFAETLATQINQLNDCPRGKFPVEFRSWKAELWQPCITMLACITPRGIARELPKAARTAGFFGRLLLVHRSYTDRRASLWSPIPESNKQLRKELEKEIAEIAVMRGPFTLDSQAQKWADDWYYDVYEPFIRTMDMPEGENTGYYGRKDSHLSRVAMVFSAAERRDRVITRPVMEEALKQLEEIEREFPNALVELGANPYTDFDRRLLETLERYTRNERWVKEKRLRRAMASAGGDRRFTEARDSLTLAGEVEVRTWEGEKEWRRIYSSGRLLRGAEEEEKKRTRKKDEDGAA